MRIRYRRFKNKEPEFKIEQFKHCYLEVERIIYKFLNKLIYLKGINKKNVTFLNRLIIYAYLTKKPLES
ncbi:hypothetical protein OCHUTO_0808 [Orientia chuto str. Dubai]|uniref:Uncharacterized protein n=1 Tax=Orientia chuto str. Dubai TaxID=1359168 RepID=A0A0F3MIK4_9RICK|nr:hypothetical protein OCHUTO_0808 [Orientia chuto str. Dubai]